MEKANGIKRYRRFHGYDYTRGARLFLTTSLAPRHPGLGRVEWLPDGQPSGGRLRWLDGGPSARQARVALTPAGEAVEAALVETPRFVPAVSLERHVVMPDHVHLLVNLRSGETQPLKTLGRFMAGFKRVAAKNAGIRWEQGYHDRICLGKEFRRHVEAYIAQNPLKWALMHSPPPPDGGPSARLSPPCRVLEPLDSPVLDDADYWRGLGALDLLEAKLCSVRVSRRLEHLPASFAARFLRGAAKGWVFLSTFLSAGERELFALLAANGGRMVVVKERGLGWVYRPDIHEAPLLGEGRLAVLGLGGPGRPTADQQEVTRAGSLLLNDKIAAMAAASGGLAMYIGEDWLEPTK